MAVVALGVIISPPYGREPHPTPCLAVVTSIRRRRLQCQLTSSTLTLACSPDIWMRPPADVAGMPSGAKGRGLLAVTGWRFEAFEAGCGMPTVRLCGMPAMEDGPIQQPSFFVHLREGGWLRCMRACAGYGCHLH